MADVLFSIGLFAGIIIAVVLIAIDNDNVVIAVGIGIGVALFSWISTIVLSGFGEIAQNVADIRAHLDREENTSK